jgi:hypothetical protein
MDKEKIKEFSTTLNKIDYIEKRCVYNNVFSLGHWGSNDLNDKFLLMSLLALMYSKLKVKDVTITPLKILLSITNQKIDESAYYQFLESISIIVEDLSFNCTKIDSCGFKTSQEIINKIKELLNTWTPF